MSESFGNKLADSERTLRDKIEQLTNSNHEAHESIGRRIDETARSLRDRIDTRATGLRDRLDTTTTGLRERIDATHDDLAQTQRDVAFIKGRFLVNPQD